MKEKQSRSRSMPTVVRKRATTPTRKEGAGQIEQRLTDVLEATTEGYWDWKPQSGEVVYGHGWLSSLGYAEEDVPEDNSFLEGVLHPDDLPGFQRDLEAHLLGTSAVFDCECRLREKSGAYKWFRVRAKVVQRDSGGLPLRAVGTVVDITPRKKAGLRESEERLRIAVHSGRMYTFDWDVKADIFKHSLESVEVLSSPPDQIQHMRRAFVDVIHPEDRHHYLHVISVLTSQNPSYRVEFRRMLPNDEIVWLEESGRAFFAQDGTLERVIGIVTDVTEMRQAERALRELSGRLITSQEEERRRIARELHDNIGQELALLAVQAQRIDSGASDEEQTTRADIHDLYKRIKDIALKVSALSHRLHSSELDFLGLGVASERLCRDFSKQHGIDVDEEIRDIPRKLEADVSLCFYRILQEALHNVAKHSQATRVQVQLSGCKNRLTLTIKDNGKGFDADKVRSESGLGIVSMKQRMHLVGGQIAIHSKTGQGSEVTAWVGLNL